MPRTTRRRLHYNGRNFFLLDNDLIDRWAAVLSPFATLVYVYLGRRASNDTGDCFPPIPTIATDLNLSESTAGRALRELRRVGLLESARRGRGRSNAYTLVLPRDVELPSRTVPQTDQDGHKNGPTDRSRTVPQTDQNVGILIHEKDTEEKEEDIRAADAARVLSTDEWDRVIAGLPETVQESALEPEPASRARAGTTRRPGRAQPATARRRGGGAQPERKVERRPAGRRARRAAPAGAASGDAPAAPATVYPIREQTPVWLALELLSGETYDIYRHRTAKGFTYVRKCVMELLRAGVDEAELQDVYEWWRRVPFKGRMGAGLAFDMVIQRLGEYRLWVKNGRREAPEARGARTAFDEALDTAAKWWEREDDAPEPVYEGVTIDAEDIT
jgi:GntR family transcriptional regulator